MTTHLTLDDHLIQEALTIGCFKSKKEAVHAALKEFIERRKQQEVIQLFGNMPFDDDYDYKKARTYVAQFYNPCRSKGIQGSHIVAYFLKEKLNKRL